MAFPRKDVAVRTLRTQGKKSRMVVNYDMASIAARPMAKSRARNSDDRGQRNSLIAQRHVHNTDYNTIEGKERV